MRKEKEIKKREERESYVTKPFPKTKVTKSFLWFNWETWETKWG